MDKETLTHYGWIVIAIVIISVLLGAAIPLASIIRDSTTSVAGALLGGNVETDSGDSGDPPPPGAVTIEVFDVLTTDFSYTITGTSFDTVRILYKETAIATFATSSDGTYSYSFTDENIKPGDVITVVCYKDGQVVATSSGTCTA